MKLPMILIAVAMAATFASTASAAMPYKASCNDVGLRTMPVTCSMGVFVTTKPQPITAKLTGLRWSSWGGPRAVATGYGVGRHTVKVVLSHPKWVEELGVNVYMHFSITEFQMFSWHTFVLGTITGVIQAN